jgi:MFS family permease
MTTPTVESPARRRPLFGLLTATAASVAANTMVTVLVAWLVLSRTGSPAQAGLVGSVALAAAVPALIAGGPLIDRWGRRRAAVGADLLSAAAVAALPLLDLTVGLSLVSTLALVATGALFDGAGAAARETTRPGVAATGDTTIDVVNARGEVAENVGEIAGPALAGVGIGVLGAMTALWVAAALLLVAAATTWLTLPPEAARTDRPEPYLPAARAGLRAVWHDSTLRAATLLGTVAMVFIAPLTLILTAHLAPRGEPHALAAIMAALGCGAIVGALGYGSLAGRLRRRPVLLTGLTAAAFGLALMALLPAPGILACLALLTGTPTPTSGPSSSPTRTSPRPSSRKPSAGTRRFRPRAGSRTPTPNSPTHPCPPTPPSWCSPPPPTATPPPIRTRRDSTRAAPGKPTTSPSPPAATTASAHRWPASKATSPSVP